MLVEVKENFFYKMRKKLTKLEINEKKPLISAD